MKRPATRHDSQISLIVATALSITIVLGAGILALPGISYLHAGRHGHWPWIIMSVVMLPMLAIFSHFGRHHPSAGGVVGYVRVSLGSRWAAVTEMIVLGTLLVGVPSISLIGASYFSQFLSGVPETLMAWLIISLSAIAALVGLRVSGPVQTAIAGLILIGLLTITTGFLLTPHDVPTLSEPVTPLLQATDADAAGILPTTSQAPSTPPPPATPAATFSWLPVLQALPAILFAYTGWELTAFLAEDMRHPQRDLPRSIWISFVLVSALYLLMAWSVATHARPDAAWYETPIARMAESWLGEAGRRAVGLIAALLVLANVMAAFLSTSRALFSAGRDGLLPVWLGTRNRHGTPATAVLITWAACSLTLLIAWATQTSTHSLLQLAGQNFFVLYLLTAIGYMALPHRHEPTPTRNRTPHPFRIRLIGSLAMLSVVGMMSLFEPLGVLYCGLLATAGYVLARPQG